MEVWIRAMMQHRAQCESVGDGQLMELRDQTDDPEVKRGIEVAHKFLVLGTTITREELVLLRKLTLCRIAAEKQSGGENYRVPRTWFYTFDDVLEMRRPEILNPRERGFVVLDGFHASVIGDWLRVQAELWLVESRLRALVHRDQEHLHPKPMLHLSPAFEEKLEHMVYNSRGFSPDSVLGVAPNSPVGLARSTVRHLFSGPNATVTEKQVRVVKRVHGPYLPLRKAGQGMHAADPACFVTFDSVVNQEGVVVLDDFHVLAIERFLMVRGMMHHAEVTMLKMKNGD